MNFRVDRFDPLRFPGTHDDPYLQQWLSVMLGKERTPEQFGGGRLACCAAGTAVLMNSRPGRDLPLIFFFYLFLGCYTAAARTCLQVPDGGSSTCGRSSFKS